jgi:hypothetical protein
MQPFGTSRSADSGGAARERGGAVMSKRRSAGTPL